MSFKNLLKKRVNILFLCLLLFTLSSATVWAQKNIAVSGTVIDASGVSIPYQGSRAAFISANAGVDYVYNPGTYQTSHFYRDIAVPAGENLIRLKFYYKNPG